VSNKVKGVSEAASLIEKQKENKRKQNNKCKPRWSKFDCLRGSSSTLTLREAGEAQSFGHLQSPRSSKAAIKQVPNFKNF